jgi:hypothetical protein
MKRLGLPMNRETYLNIAWMGEVPDELSADYLASIPEQFRTKAE